MIRAVVEFEDAAAIRAVSAGSARLRLAARRPEGTATI